MNSSDTKKYPTLSSCCRELLVVTGGYSWNSILARTEALNMTAEEGNRWRRLAPLLKPRYLHACSPVQLGTEVSTLLNSEESFLIGDMDLKVYGLQIYFKVGVLVAGGYSSSYLNSTEVYRYSA